MADKELFRLLDGVPTPIFVMDVREGRDATYAHYNATALKMLGRPLSDFVGYTTKEAFGAEYGQTAADEQNRTIAAQEQRCYEFKLPFGASVSIIRTTLCPLKDETGKVVRLIGSAADVTTEWLADAAQSRLDTLGNDVEQFVNMAAHDLRTPMRNVSMLAEMLRDGFIDKGDGKLDLIDLLEETASKAMHLINDVLSHAKASGISDTPSLFEVAELIDKIHATLDPYKSHKIECDPMTISGERTIFQIVLHNLIDNAIKHGGSDALNLRCSVRAYDHDMIEITLNDGGKGFANPGVLFLETGQFRVDSGYGLLGIRRLVLSRGGDISAFNGDGEAGGTIRFRLPGRAVTNREGVVDLTLARNTSTEARLRRHGGG